MVRNTQKKLAKIKMQQKCIKLVLITTELLRIFIPTDLILRYEAIVK
jgi:hypothetical protein